MYFLEVIAELVKVQPKLKVVLCGSGPEDEKLKKQIVAAGLEQCVFMTGVISSSGSIAMDAAVQDLFTYFFL
jgi:glycosyltransferase involved in cell wall biosynthesis